MNFKHAKIRKKKVKERIFIVGRSVSLIKLNWRYCKGMCDQSTHKTDQNRNQLTRTLAKFVSVSRTIEENLSSHSIARRSDKNKRRQTSFVYYEVNYYNRRPRSQEMPFVTWSLLRDWGTGPPNFITSHGNHPSNLVSAFHHSNVSRFDI